MSATQTISASGRSSSAVASFLIGRAISSAGNNSTFVSLVFAVTSIGGGPAMVGVVLGTSTVPRVLFTLLGGVAGDVRSRRSILIVCDASMAAVQGITAALLLTGACEIWHLIVLQAAAGTLAAYSSPAQSGVLPLLAPKERLRSLNSLFQSLKNGAAIAGPAIGGLLVTVWSPGVAIGFDAVTFMIAAALMATLPRLSPAAQSEGALRDIKPAFRQVRIQPWIGLMILTFTLYQASVLPAIYVLGPLLGPDGSAASWAAILVARSVGGLALPILMLRWSPDNPLQTSSLLLLLDLPFLGLLVTGAPLALLCATGAISAGAATLADVLWETTLQTEVPPAYLSRVISLDWLGSLAVAPLGYVVVGLVADQSSVVAMMIVVAALHAAARVLVMFLRPIRHFRTSVA